MPGQMPQAAHRLANRTKRRLVAIGPVLPVAGDTRDDEPRIHRVQFVRSDFQPLQLPRAHVLDQHIGARRKFQQRIPVLLQIQFDRELVAAVHAEPD